MKRSSNLNSVSSYIDIPLKQNSFIQKKKAVTIYRISDVMKSAS